MRYNMKKDTITSYGALVIFTGIFSTVFTQQVDEGNYIVPRATLDLGHRTNKSAAGQRRRCQSNLDCKGLEHNQCCLTISGFLKCRKKCRKQPKLGLTFEINQNKGGNTYVVKEVSQLPGCNAGNKVYKEGARIVKGDCDKCMCKKGRINCKCPPATCTYKGKQYNDGHHLILHNGCKRCKCRQKVWNCSSHPCEDFKRRNLATFVAPSSVSALITGVTLTYLFWLT